MSKEKILDDVALVAAKIAMLLKSGGGDQKKAEDMMAVFYDGNGLKEGTRFDRESYFFGFSMGICSAVEVLRHSNPIVSRMLDTEFALGIAGMALYAAAGKDPKLAKLIREAKNGKKK